MAKLKTRNGEDKGSSRSTKITSGTVDDSWYVANPLFWLRHQFALSVFHFLLGIHMFNGLIAQGTSEVAAG